MNNPVGNRKTWMPKVPQSPLMVVADFAQRRDVWNRLGICAAASLLLWLVMSGWNPSFSYRLRQTPLRNMYARVKFEYDDFKLTEEFRDRTRRNFLCFYAHDPQPLTVMIQGLMVDLNEIRGKSYEELGPTEIWSKFYQAPRPDESLEIRDPQVIESDFNTFKLAIEGPGRLETLEAVVKAVVLEISQFGLLQTLEHEIGSGSMSEIFVYPTGDLDARQRVSVSQVRISEVTANLRERLLNELRKHPEELVSDPNTLARRLFHWLRRQMPSTLSYDSTHTERELNRALDQVGIQQRTFEPGERLEQYRRDLNLRGIVAAVPLNQDDLDLLYAEHQALLKSQGWGAKLLRTLFFFFSSLGFFALVSQYLFYRHQPILNDLRQFTFLIVLLTGTLILAWFLALSPTWRAEIIPMMILAFLVAIAYRIELAIFLTTLVALFFTLSHGYGVAEFVILAVASTVSAFMCHQIRSRTRLVNISVIVAAIIFPTVIGVNYLLGQPLTGALFKEAGLFAGGACIAGLIITALLPFLERLFSLETDINLLELIDQNNVLLRELIQRAPGTYNHSINVASISEAAAEAIGANGLLCRVGAYFHDIGKIRKPEYFVENQTGVNKHDLLQPTMSRLVIIAHVKDGIELARTHRLPQRVIDLIEQHHGTTVVEFFYNRAGEMEMKKAEELQEQVDEAGYRYPGPKPQTLEAAVLMLSDAVESASRSLREPAPSRLEHLVFEMTKKKLEDGQFDECPISMNQISLVQRSLIKSLNAMYHARVQYPEKQAQPV
jgi:putative nucleotidyltransferase with HDIG domain